MDVIRRTKKYKLNKGSLQASGLYNVTSTDEEATEISLWFDAEEKRKLMNMDTKQFNAACKEMCAAAANIS